MHKKSDIARSNQLLLLTDMLITLRDLLDVGDKMKILEPSLGYWNTANMTELKIFTRIFRLQNIDVTEKTKIIKLGASP